MPEPSTSTTDRPSTSPRGRPHPVLVAGLALLAVAGIVSGILQVLVVIRAESLKRSDEISGCRSAYRVALVDAPTFRALKAYAEDDEMALVDALDQGNPERYEALVLLSNEDPGAFLRVCRAETP